jgi:hypothetical protein
MISWLHGLDISWILVGTGLDSSAWMNKRYYGDCNTNFCGIATVVFLGFFMFLCVSCIRHGSILLPYQYGKLIKAFEQDAMACKGQVVGVCERSRQSG